MIAHVAVIDIGKTNAKLALVDAASLTEIAVEKRPNRVLPGPPWPHFDTDATWDFITATLAAFQRTHGVDAISVATHGASGVLLDGQGGLAAPMLDYEHDGPDSLRAEYDRIRPPFEETGSPRLAGGLNLGAQIFWQFAADPGLDARTAHIVTHPQYWGFRLTGELASDVCSLGAHTDLWNPWERRFSSLVESLGIGGRLAAPMLPGQRLGTVRPALCAAFGLAPGTPVSVGIHDSNASLLPYLSGREAPFSVVSTGTWVIAMAIGGAGVTLAPERDTLVNVNAFGDPVPSARFMGGREFEVIAAGSLARPTDTERTAVLENDVMLLPAVDPLSGPFQGREARWTGEPQSEGQRLVAASYYLALMTDTCLGLAGARGPAIVEGPFAANPDFTAMLAALRAEGVETAASSTGTSVGAALLLIPEAGAPATRPIAAPADPALVRYAERWRARTAAA